MRVKLFLLWVLGQYFGPKQNTDIDNFVENPMQIVQFSYSISMHSQLMVI